MVDLKINEPASLRTPTSNDKFPFGSTAGGAGNATYETILAAMGISDTGSGVVIAAAERSAIASNTSRSQSNEGNISTHSSQIAVINFDLTRLISTAQTLTFSTALVFNTGLGRGAKVTLTGNTKPALLSGGPLDGEINVLVLIQDATGGRHVDWGNFVGEAPVGKENGARTTVFIYIESATIQHVMAVGSERPATRRIVLYPSSSFTNTGGGATDIYDRVVTDTTWSWSDVRKYEFCTYTDLQYSGPVFSQAQKDKLTTVVGNATNIKVLAFIRQDLWWYWNESLIQFTARQWGTITSKPTVGMGGDVDDGIVWATNQAVIEGDGYSQPSEHDTLTNDGALLTNPYEISLQQSPKRWWARNNRMDIADETWLDLLTDNIVAQRRLEMKVHGFYIQYAKIQNYAPGASEPKQLHEWIAGTGNPGWVLSTDSGGSGSWSDPDGTISELYDAPKSNTVVDVVDSATKIVEMLRYKDPGAILVFAPNSLTVDSWRNTVSRAQFRVSAIAKHSFITNNAEADLYWAEQVSYAASMCDASGGGVEFEDNDDADDFSVEWADSLRGLDRGYIQRSRKPQNISILADQ